MKTHVKDKLCPKQYPDGGTAYPAPPVGIKPWRDSSLNQSVIYSPYTSEKVRRGVAPGSFNEERDGLNHVLVFQPLSVIGFLMQGADGGPLDSISAALLTSPGSYKQLEGILLKPRSSLSLQGNDSHDFWALPAPQTVRSLKKNQLL